MTAYATPEALFNPVPGTYQVLPPAVTDSRTCASFHQQVQALAPNALASTYGTSTHQFASLTTPDGRQLAYADGEEPAAVLAELRAQLPELLDAAIDAQRAGLAHMSR